MVKFNRPQTQPEVFVKRGRGRRPGEKQTPAKKYPKPILGAPQKYKPKLADEICEFLSQGYSLNTICKMEGMPSYTTVMAWLWRDSDYREDFLNKYEKARQQQADYMADQILDIADDGLNDYMELIDPKTGLAYDKFDKENVQRSRLRVDARKWVAAHLKPKKYGELVKLSGPNEEPLIPASRTIVFDFGVDADGSSSE